MKKDVVYLTFPTDRGTLELINQIAKIKGLTQPAMLNEICQEYFRNNTIHMIGELMKMGIDVNELLENSN